MLAALSPQPTPNRLREINNPLTWVYCFLTFIAAKTNCETTRSLAAYAQIVIQLARKHGGSGWMAYDHHFRQQLAGGADLQWNDINNSLMSATVLAPPPDDAHKRTVCSICRGDDHIAAECALGSLQPATTHSHQQQQLSTLTKPKQRPHPYRGWESLCKNFNRGGCPLEAAQCRFEHCCILCDKPGHGAKECNEKAGWKGKSRPPFTGSRRAPRGPSEAGPSRS